MEYEIYHHGIKGMKWGVRKARKYESNTERKYTRAGRMEGRASYYRSAGNDAVKKHNANAKLLEKAAKQYDATGNVFKAEASRRAASALRQRGENIRRSQNETAAHYEARAKRITEKASTYATKKRVNLGKAKIDEILKKGKLEGFEWAKTEDEFGREQDARSRYGDDAVDMYNRIRGV